MRNLLLLFAILVLPALVFSQEAKKQYKVGCIGFYNVENLFDTLDTPGVNDADFTPQGSYRYGTAIYVEKQEHLARVISEMGTDLTPDGVAVLGVAEVENRAVLEDLVAQERIKNRNYQIVHYDSPDFRGIDVALLYQPKYFRVTHSRPIPVPIKGDDGTDRYTRDILFVSGIFDGEPMHFLVNHWPSRRGGEAATQPLRNFAASLCKNIADSLIQENPNAKIFIMGDLNDDPSSPSVRQVLNAKQKKEQVKPGGMFNPMYDLYKKGIGTLAWQDAWSLFDQIIISYGPINEQAGGYRFHQAHVHNKPYLFQPSGHFKGYPFRTFAGSTYLGGYSDHFPVYLYLLKEVQPIARP
ncbi:MAG TPA: endonuclease/exonuclease/phosphatase family protein [Saprospiraceae bacterium]|nr:endonuclease/exonuclease/phosphatase family protein [Saprospiraceae bacterium]HMO40261.1 endonuclease/exonuclease/phosphatase family protein [Saprospiraceae bacterium]HMP23288.1 endonuclease/exonuclease/phosphatase family protein [Saprospiraceae bacterium]